MTAQRAAGQNKGSNTLRVERGVLVVYRERFAARGARTRTRLRMRAEIKVNAAAIKAAQRKLPMSKMIICISEGENQGKTEIIRELAKILNAIQGSSSSGSIPPAGDFSLEITVNGKICGLESKGDPTTGLYARLEPYAKKPCDVIVCASRTRCSTVEDVENIATTYHYEIIWTSPYLDNNNPPQPQPTPRQHQLNTIKAKNIEYLLQQLGLFP